jgi:PAS domain S-box-containing protein
MPENSARSEGIGLPQKMIIEKKNRSSLTLALLDDAPIAIITAHGPDLSIEFVNRLAVVLLQSKTEQPIGESLSELLPELFSEAIIKAIHSTCFGDSSKLSFKEHEIALLEDGKLHVAWFDITIQPVVDAGGKTDQLVLYLADVSAKVMASRSIMKHDDIKNSQSVLQQLIDSSVELIAVVDRKLHFLAVNKAFETFMSRSRVDLVGKHIFEAYSGARGTRQVELLQKALAGERLHLKANPSISRPQDVWFDTHFVPLEIDSKIEGVIVLSRDISEIIKSEQQLVKVNNQLGEAQRLSKLGSWEWDVDSGNVIWSDEMYRIYGYEEKFRVDFVKATERMSPERADRSSKRTQQHIQTAMDNFKRTGELVSDISSVEFPIKLPNGEEKILRSSGKLELNSEGKLHRILGAIQDVTEIRATEEKLRLLVDELEIKNRDLESFNFVASHDLQEPLRKVQTFIDRIKNGSPTPEVQRDYLNRIDSAAKRMTDLIQSMLTLGRLSKHEDQFTDVDLNAIVDFCKSEFELLIKEKDARIDCEKLPIIRASDFQMRQLFINLISNSFKFSKEKPLIRISSEKVKRSKNAEDDSSDYWRLTFIDNGIGFDPKYKEQIFELFQRLHSKSEFSGTGIGLSIVKRIVERHNGFIEATSEVGKGASFSIYLPTTEF